MRRTTAITLLAVFAFACLLAMGPMAVYLRHFGNQDVADEPGAWGQFGDYVGGVLNPIFALLNLLAVVYLAFEVHHLEGDRQENAQREQRKQNTHRIYHIFNSNEFYRQVRAVAWRASIEWRQVQRNNKEKPDQPPEEYRPLLWLYNYDDPRVLEFSELERQQAEALFILFTTLGGLQAEIDAGLLDEKIVQMLFRHPYRSYFDVIDYCRVSWMTVESIYLDKGLVAQAWMEQTRRLDCLFAPNNESPTERG